MIFFKKTGYATAHIGKWHLGGLRIEDVQARKEGIDGHVDIFCGENGLEIFLSCLLALTMIRGCQSHSETPNIVFILVDDMGFSNPGCYGAEILETPHIDALAEGGLRFTNFYNTGRCWPTWTSLLSGFYPHQVLSDPMPGVDYSKGSVVPVNTTWLPAVLKDHGYRTYHSGKWHIVRKFPEQSLMSHVEVGFDRSYRTIDHLLI